MLLGGQYGRGHTPDFTLELALRDFQTSDISLLAEALNLTDTAPVTLNALDRGVWPGLVREVRGPWNWGPQRRTRLNRARR